MCGRFSQSQDLDLLQDRFDFLADHLDYTPRYNLAPGQKALVVASGGKGRRGAMMRWGLVPSWAQEEKAGYRMINARAEGIESKPGFRGPLKRSRCLVPADGFYEWARRPGGRQPFRLVRRDRQLFALAGLWDTWPDPRGGELKSFAIITIPANRVVGAIHERMPAMLAPQDEAPWLDHHLSDPAQLRQMLRPYPDDLLEAYPVSTRVNSPAHEGPELIEPLRRQGDLFADQVRPGGVS